MNFQRILRLNLIILFLIVATAAYSQYAEHKYERQTKFLDRPASKFVGLSLDNTIGYGYFGYEASKSEAGVPYTLSLNIGSLSFDYFAQSMGSIISFSDVSPLISLLYKPDLMELGDSHLIWGGAIGPSFGFKTVNNDRTFVLAGLQWGFTLNGRFVITDPYLPNWLLKFQVFNNVISGVDGGNKLSPSVSDTNYSQISTALAVTFGIKFGSSSTGSGPTLFGFEKRKALLGD